MNDPSNATDFVLSNEDAGLEYADVPDPVPDGPNDSFEEMAMKRNARAISGINSFYWTEDYNKIKAIPQAERGLAVRAFYPKNFWGAWLAQIIDDDLAARVMDSGVNQGAGTACGLLQRAVNSLGGVYIEPDGHWGPITLAAVNNQNPFSLLNAFRTVRAAKYREQGNLALVPRAEK